MSSIKKNFQNELDTKNALLFDGAFGTELYMRGIFINRCFEEANLKEESLVREILSDYKKAGADILTTNTYGANEFKLKRFNLEDQVYQINFKGAQIARSVASDELFVAGSIGPLGIRIEPLGKTSLLEARKAFKEQAGALIEGGVDLLILETFSDLQELEQAILAIREYSSIPIIACVTINDHYTLPLGTPVEQAMKYLDKLPINAIGLNCSVGPQLMLTCVEQIKHLITKPLCVRPNAGFPKEVDGRMIYMSSSEYFANYAKKFLQAGVQIIGGCCGTSPKHTKLMANAIRYAKACHEPERTSKVHFEQVRTEQTDSQKVLPLSENKSHWASCIAKGEKVFSVELLPPQGTNPKSIIEKSAFLKTKGIHAINIPDGPRASARMSAILTAVMIEQQAKIETVLHYTCRDRNLLGMQSDMLGAQAMGLKNLLLVTGDPPKMGVYPDATGVFDIDSIGLTNMVRRLNEGYDLGQKPIDQPCSFSIGVGVNPVHRDFEYEMKRFQWKVEAGAQWAISQPVFCEESFLKFLDYCDKHNLKIPIIAGIWPLVSYQNAIFLHNEVPGVVIPEKVLERLSQTKTKEEAREIGVELCQQLIFKLNSYIQGVQVSAPFGNIEVALKVLEK